MYLKGNEIMTVKKIFISISRGEDDSPEVNVEGLEQHLDGTMEQGVQIPDSFDWDKYRKPDDSLDLGAAYKAIHGHEPDATENAFHKLVEELNGGAIYNSGEASLTLACGAGFSTIATEMKEHERKLGVLHETMLMFAEAGKCAAAGSIAGANARQALERRIEALEASLKAMQNVDTAAG
jgi:hypothetical protein